MAHAVRPLGRRRWRARSPHTAPCRDEFRLPCAIASRLIGPAVPPDQAIVKAPIRGVLFDKDGTLINYFATWTPAYLAAADEIARLAGEPALAPKFLLHTGYDPVADTYVSDCALVSGTTAQIALMWQEIAPSLVTCDDLAERIERIFHRVATDNPIPITDLAGLFGRLRRSGLRLGVATNNSIATARATIDQLGLGPMVDFVAGYDSGYGPKPSTGMLEAFCRATGLASHEVAVVGDSPVDLNLARNGRAGMGIAVLSGVSPRAALEPLADHIIADIRELEPLLERLLQRS